MISSREGLQDDTPMKASEANNDACTVYPTGVATPAQHSPVYSAAAHQRAHKLSDLELSAAHPVRVR